MICPCKIQEAILKRHQVLHPRSKISVFVVGDRWKLASGVGRECAGELGGYLGA